MDTWPRKSASAHDMDRTHRKEHRERFETSNPNKFKRPSGRRAEMTIGTRKTRPPPRNSSPGEADTVSTRETPEINAPKFGDLEPDREGNENLTDRVQPYTTGYQPRKAKGPQFSIVKHSTRRESARKLQNDAPEPPKNAIISVGTGRNENLADRV